MKLHQILEELPKTKEQFHNGINFETKSRFLGYSIEERGGQPKVILSVEQLESDRWGFCFQPMDREFLKVINGLFDSFGVNPPKDKILESGFDHPCRETCSGWRQGYDRGVYDLDNKIRMLKQICERFEKASNNKRTKEVSRWFGKYYQDQETK